MVEFQNRWPSYCGIHRLSDLLNAVAAALTATVVKMSLEHGRCSLPSLPFHNSFSSTTRATPITAAIIFSFRDIEWKWDLPTSSRVCFLRRHRLFAMSKSHCSSPTRILYFELRRTVSIISHWFPSRLRGEIWTAPFIQLRRVKGAVFFQLLDNVLHVWLLLFNC